MGQSPCDNSVTAAQRLHAGLVANPPPQVLLLQDGANDINGGIVDALTVALRDMIRDARANGVRVFVGTLLPQTPRACRAFGASLVVPANDQIRPMVVAEGAVLVDLWQGFQPDPGLYLGVDGLHPNSMGYQRMMELFFSSIREQLEVAP
jgi:lysophospholipase L1-like esterase